MGADTLENLGDHRVKLLHRHLVDTVQKWVACVEVVT